MTGNAISQSCDLLVQADALLIAAGAGMGCDSGLPDFRGAEGFWRAYPALANSGMVFSEIANPQAFEANPKLAWGFYGHRLKLYRSTIPHSGFASLLKISKRLAHGEFVVTSNVDGQFQKAGFDPSRVLEIHGSIHRLQCCTPCRDTVWSADRLVPQVDDGTCLWTAQLPQCDRCHGIARPNILMFDDWYWLDQRRVTQESAFDVWKQAAQRPVVIEVGAGLAIPSIRHISQNQRAPVIRINPRDHQLPEGLGVSLALGAREAIEMIETELDKRGFFSDVSRTY